MFRMYQNKWFSIKLSDVTQTKIDSLPTSRFYGEFYKCFFELYDSPSDLSEGWRLEKQSIAHFLRDSILGRGSQSVLSVGCGVGYVELCLKDMLPSIDFNALDYSSDNMRWIESHFEPNQLFSGELRDCSFNEKKFDFIYLSALDYALDDAEFLEMLKILQLHLAENGLVVLISPSCISHILSLKSIKILVKSVIAKTIDLCKVNLGWQFWGWYRTRGEIRYSFRKANINILDDGFLRSKDGVGKNYFILGQVGKS